MSSGLAVPIRLDALPIGLPDAQNDNFFRPAAANFTQLPVKGATRRPYLASEVLSDPFSGNRPLEQGIHLHWALPRAITVAAFDESGSMALLAAPDRWLITRVIVDLANAQAPQVALRSWVLESNFLSGASTFSRSSFPADPATVPPYQFLGRAYEYDQWSANGTGPFLSPLTSMGYGIPEFAAFYPSSRNVFGFLDDTLNDFDPASKGLAYIVTGWYSTAADDPLNGTSISGSGNDFGWLFSGSGTPEYSLFHGAVTSVNWQPDAAYFPNFKDVLGADLAVGNTPAEALAALANAKVEAQSGKDVELLLNALQVNALPLLNEPGGIPRVEQSIFDREFTMTNPGIAWDVRPATAPPAGERRRSPRAAVRAANPLAGDLAKLNELQGELEAEQATRLSLQRQVFADWAKSMVIAYSSGTFPDINKVRSFIRKEIAAIADVDARIAAKLAEIDRQKAAIVSQLPADLELTQKASPRFYGANDLVVLLSGDGVTPAPPDYAKAIDCVLTDDLLRRIDLPKDLVPGSDAIGLDASSLPGIGDASKLPHGEIASLVQSVQLAGDPDVVTAAVAALGGTANPAVLDFSATRAKIAEAQQGVANGITFTGSLPQRDISLRPWDIPWNPIALSWRFTFSPPAAVATKGEDYPSDFVTKNFTFDRSSFDLRLDEESFSTLIQQYSGSVLLSRDASISLQQQIRDFLRWESDPQLDTILKELGQFPVLAQSLGGFGASLTMLDETMQMPVWDPLATGLLAEFSNVTVHDAVGDQNQLSPLLLNDYNPLRAGQMLLTDLILIDEFGRFRTVDVDRIVISDTIPRTSSTPPALVLPLRIAQDAKLEMRWLSADDPARQTSNIPQSSPICGWVVPNNLDTSLMFYDATGAAIGSLTASADLSSTLWLVAPGTLPIGTSMEDAFAHANAVLKGFAFNVRDLGGQYLAALIQTIAATRVFIAPQNYELDRDTAVLVGEPLAIVQAELDLSLLGLPLPDQSMDALQKDIDRGDPLVRTTHNFENVEFPILLGSLTELDDGLIGFFLGTEWSTFYAEAAQGANEHIVVPDSGTLTLTPSSSATPKTITMLVDPRAEVHAFTGLSPVKTINIPSNIYADALARMSFTFLTTPVLAPAGEFSIPVPTEGDGDWRWVTWTGSDWSESAIAQPDDIATLQTAGHIVEGWLKLSERKEVE